MTDAARPDRAWPAGDGEMATRIRAHDWAATPLGPVETWPEQLKHAVEQAVAMPGSAAERASGRGALADSEQRFRAFVTASADMVYRVNSD